MNINKMDEDKITPSWGGYHEAVKSCNENVEKLSELDAVFSHIEKIENIGSLEELNAVLKSISKEDQNKLNSPLLDSIFMLYPLSFKKVAFSAFQIFIFVLNLYKKKVETLEKEPSSRGRSQEHRTFIEKILRLYSDLDYILASSKEPEKRKVLLEMGARIIPKEPRKRSKKRTSERYRSPRKRSGTTSSERYRSPRKRSMKKSRKNIK